jgi:phage-related minor tail protein
MSDLGTAALSTEVDLSGLEGGLGEAETTTQSRLGSMAESLKGSLGLAFAGIGVALAGALAGAGVAAVDIAAQFRDAQGQMQAQLGVTAEEAQALGDVARDVFGNNFGDSVEDVGQSIIEVRQQMKGLADEELGAATESALALRDAFGFEVAESTNAANTLMEEFGLTSQQAFDFIAKGQQLGLNTSGDFLETIGEYSTQFSNGGASADQFFSLLQSGMQGGVLGTDKIADSFKEFQLRVLDGSEATREAMTSLGLEDVLAGVENGTISVADAYGDVRDALAEIEDPALQMQLATAVIGTQFEDMGAAAFLAGDMSVTSLEEMAGATSSLNAQYTSLGGVWEGVSRGFLLALEPLGIALLDIANVAMPYLLAGAEQLRQGIEVAIGFIGPFVAGVVAFLMGLFAGDGTAALGTWGQAFTDAQTLIGGVMVAIQGVVQPILAILSAFWAQHGAEIQAFAAQAWNQIASIVQGVLAILNATIIPILTTIGGFIASHSSEIQTVLSAAWTIISTVIGTTLANIQSVVNVVLAALRGDWGGAWTEIQAIADRSIRAVQTVVSTVLSTIQTLWGSAISGLQTKASEILGGLKGTFESNLNGIADFIGGLAGRFLSAGQALINNLRDGIMGTIAKLIADVKAELKKLADLLPGSEPRDPTSPLRGLGRRGEAFVANFMDPLISSLASANLRPALAGISGQLDAAMMGELAGASASANADVRVRLDEGGLRGVVQVEVDKTLAARGRSAQNRGKLG